MNTSIVCLGPSLRTQFLSLISARVNRHDKQHLLPSPALDYPVWVGIWRTQPCIVYEVNAGGDYKTFGDLGSVPPIVPASEVHPATSDAAANFLRIFTHFDQKDPSWFSLSSPEAIVRADILVAYKQGVSFRLKDLEQAQADLAEAQGSLRACRQAHKDAMLAFGSVFETKDKKLSVRVASGAWSALSSADAKKLQIFVDAAQSFALDT